MKNRSGDERECQKTQSLGAPSRTYDLGALNSLVRETEKEHAIEDMRGEFRRLLEELANVEAVLTAFHARRGTMEATEKVRRSLERFLAKV